jgi:hypothetical protein
LAGLVVALLQSLSLIAVVVVVVVALLITRYYAVKWAELSLSLPKNPDWYFFFLYRSGTPDR